MIDTNVVLITSEISITYSKGTCHVDQVNVYINEDEVRSWSRPRESTTRTPPSPDPAAANDRVQIYTRTIRCKEMFVKCKDIPELEKDDWLDDRRADFNWWAYGINAEKTGRSSLDYRVKDRPDIEEILLGLLDALVANLMDCVSPAQDGFPEASIPDAAPALAEEDEDGRLSPWSDLSGSDSGRSDHDQSLLSPLSEQKFYIEHNLHLLSRLTIEIKRSGSKFRHQRADETLAATNSHYNDLRKHLCFIILLKPVISRIWEHILGRKWPTAVGIVIQAWALDISRLSPSQRRLVDAVILRRNRFLYASNKHKERRGLWEAQGASAQRQVRGDESPVVLKPTLSSLEGLPPQIAPNRSASHLGATPSVMTGVSTEPATAIPSDFVVSPVVERAAKSVHTQISRRGMQQDYPGCPAKGNAFTCPYCFSHLPATYAESKERWRGHVAQDISPYMCIFEGCAAADQLYASSEQWLAHTRKFHGVTRWDCTQCSESASNEEECAIHNVQEWEQHSSTHKDLIPPSVLSKLSERTAIPAVYCPLCPHTEGPLEVEIDDHILEHIHSFALRSLPWHAIDAKSDTVDSHVAIVSRGSSIDSEGSDIGEEPEKSGSTDQEPLKIIARECLDTLRGGPYIKIDDRMVSVLSNILALPVNSISRDEAEIYVHCLNRLHYGLLQHAIVSFQPSDIETIDKREEIIREALGVLHSFSPRAMVQNVISEGESCYIRKKDLEKRLFTLFGAPIGARRINDRWTFDAPRQVTRSELRGLYNESEG